MNNERSAFGELVERHQKKVFQVALSILGDKEEALDITQHVFIKAYNVWGWGRCQVFRLKDRFCCGPGSPIEKLSVCD